MYASFLKAEHEFTFKDVTEKPVPSLLRNFSAPVRLNTDVTDDDLLFLLAHDSDEFNRYFFFMYIILSLERTCKLKKSFTFKG